MKKLLLLLLCLFIMAPAKSANTTFATEKADPLLLATAKTSASTGLNLSFIRGKNQITPALFNRLNGTGLPEDEEFLKIYINKTLIYEGVIKLNIVNNQLCVVQSWLDRANIDHQQMAQLYNSSQNCYEIEQIQYASVQYVPNNNLIKVQIPQLYHKQGSQNRHYDTGATALKLDYRFNLYKNQGSDPASYASGTAQLNLGSWVLLNDWYYQSDRSLESSSTRLYRSLYDIGSELHIGNLWAQPFNSQSFEFKGLTLKTDSSLRDWRDNIYAPVLKGVAQTTARVSVYQGDRLLSEETVSPGPFEISDYAPVGNGNIKLVITEETGEQQIKTYPVATLPNMIRSGISNYTFSIGSKTSLSDNESLFLNMNYDIGFEAFGLSSGVILNQKYQSVGLGITGPLTDYGVLSFTNSLSNAFNSDTEQWKQGLSLQLKYAKKVGDYTDFRIIGYHHNDKSYVDFAHYSNTYRFSRKRNKNRYELVLNNRFDSFSIDASGWLQNYWDYGDSDLGYDVTLSSLYRNIRYSVSAGRQENRYNDENTFSFNVSLPLSRESYLSNSFYYQTNADTYSNVLNYNQRLSNDWNYGLSVNSTEDDPLYTTATTSYRTDYFSIGGLVANRQDRYTLSGNLSGSVIGLWDDKSLTFTNNRGSTIAVVKLAQIENAQVNGGHRTNSKGYTVVSLSANDQNRIKVDTRNIDEVIELDTPILNLTPTKSSIHALSFNYNRVNRYIFKLVDHNRQPLPFGAEILTEQGDYIAFVSSNGIVQFSLEEKALQQTMQTSNGDNVCRFDISQIPPYQSGEEISNVYCQ